MVSTKKWSSTTLAIIRKDSWAPTKPIKMISKGWMWVMAIDSFDITGIDYILKSIKILIKKPSYF